MITFRYLPYDILKANIKKLLEEVANGRQKKCDPISPVCEENMEYIKRTISSLDKVESFSSDRQPVKIAMGLLLHIKEKQLTHRTRDEGIRWLFGMKPENTCLIDGINKAIGITEENRFDFETAHEVQAAFNQFMRSHD